MLAQPHPFASLVVDTDAYAAYMGAFDGRDGAILIVGTGTAGLAVIKGERISVGGWGHEIADEGSGMMIGRTAIRRALWAFEGMAPMTPLADEILDRFERTPTVAVAWADGAGPRDFGSFAPLVFDHADRRDPLAMAIIAEAAKDVSRLIERLLEVGAPAVAMIGSVFPRILPWLPPPLAARLHRCRARRRRRRHPHGGAGARRTGQGVNAMLDLVSGNQRSPALDEASPTPLYLQLQRLIQDAVDGGRLQADEALPSERDLARELGISRVTVRKAIAGLVEKGILVQRWGSGTFIAPAMRVEQPLSRLSSFTDDMMTRGLKPGARVLERSSGPSSPKESMALGLSPGEPVSRLRRLRLAGGVPMAIEHAVVPARFLPDPGIVEHSLYAALNARGHAPRRALQRLHAVLTTAEQAKLLDVPPASPALYIERRSFLDSGDAVEFTASSYRGDAYDFVAELSIGER